MLEFDQLRHNGLLASLPHGELELLRPQLEQVHLPMGKVLHESGMPRQFAYFPTTAIVSLIYTMENGATLETAVVGPEGAVGICIFMGGGSMPIRAVVHSAGEGFRIRADAMRASFERSVPVQRLMLRYTQALLTQMSQAAVCNRHHSVIQRLCMWMLLGLDRQPGNDLVMTQELIAHMLGVRREGVTEAALKLQARGVIRYGRGRITVLNRTGLEQRVCECYGVVRREYDRLLHEPEAA